MLKTIFFLLVLLLGVNAALVCQNLKTEASTNGSCRLVAAARKTKDDSGSLMLPASTMLLTTMNLFK